MVGAFFIDIVNALVIKLYLMLPIQLFHVHIGRVEEAAFIANRQYGQRVCSTHCRHTRFRSGRRRYPQHRSLRLVLTFTDKQCIGKLRRSRLRR